MPELPEVETIRRGLQPHLADKRLSAVVVRRKHLRWEIPTAQVNELKNKNCVAVERRGKYILMHFDGENERVALIHLGMSGRLFLDNLIQQKAELSWEKHEHWRMYFGQKLLRFFDPRRFGMLDVTHGDGVSQHWLLKALGPDPFDPTFSPAHLFELSRNRQVMVKDFLMNARVVAGIGNIYASEVCFRAKIKPQRPVGQITKKEAVLLFEAIQEILSKAVDSGGTTFSDFCDINRHSGAFQHHLFVYKREGLPCHICNQNIKKIIIGQRSSFYCSKCQR